MITNVRGAMQAHSEGLNRRNYAEGKSNEDLRRVISVYKAHHAKPFFERVRARWDMDWIPTEREYSWANDILAERCSAQEGSDRK